MRATRTQAGKSTARLAMLIAGLLCAPLSPALAGSATAAFPVNITLGNPAAGGASVLPASGTTVPSSGICINQALSEAARATVKVVCSANQFVSIAPLPGAPYLGTHGGAFRYLLTQASFQAGDDLWEAGMGTVTTLQIVPQKRTPWDIAEIQISY